MKKFLTLIVVLVLLLVVAGQVLAASDVNLHYVWYDWVGSYTGEVDSNGVPYGHGLFESETPIDGFLWRYIGEWKDGLPNGLGTIYYDNCSIETGTYVNGVLQQGARYIVTGLRKEEIKPVTKENGSGEVVYIGNKKSMKFHYPDCKSVGATKESNRVELYSREEAIERGFSPCGSCHP